MSSLFIKLRTGDKIRADTITAVRVCEAFMSEATGMYPSRVVIDFSSGSMSNSIVINCNTIAEAQQIANSIMIATDKIVANSKSNQAASSSGQVSEDPIKSLTAVADKLSQLNERVDFGHERAEVLYISTYLYEIIKNLSKINSHKES